MLNGWHSILDHACHAVAETLRAVSQGLKDTVRKVSESALFNDYGRMCLVVDEVINEVQLHLCCAYSNSATPALLLRGFAQTPVPTRMNALIESDGACAEAH